MTTTMKKRLPPSSSPSIRQHFWLGLQLVLSLSVLVCVLALLRLNSQSQSSPAAFSPLRRPSSFSGPPKIAFLFLARSNLPLDFVWHAFFQNADEENYSIYIHSEPGFVFDESTTRSPFLYGRQLKNSVKVVWGESSMIQAERLLLATALDDPANQRFALISDSFLDKKEGRYNPKMSPAIPKDKWRKGSQWITLVRRHAEVVVADNVIFPTFKRYCKRQTELDFGRKQIINAAAQKQHDCIPDEHYVQTLLSMSELEDELERRTLTYTSWNQSSNDKEKQNWHPMTFEYADAGPQHIKEIRNINYVYYETEYRTEWCQCNATFVPCFLFARKFSRGAAMRLLNEGLVGPFDASTLLFSSS
ncbi:glycosyltransferase BC10 isoform X2 [Elaeis guineensis]|uniref:Glycosyltransferase BC10 isoform X2 n=1 Tax=Elaeis guineensis var. tenera TaxID=51953 RepID=A0A8N4F713_ELAGV|nr:glycosyltransferase BC10 isoform X2 [Elaeis guineensis]